MAQTISDQVKLASQVGGTDKVKTSMQCTGIHDHTVENIATPLLDLGKALRKHGTGNPMLAEPEIQLKLAQELKKLVGENMLDTLINPLILQMPGNAPTATLWLFLTSYQVSTCTLTCRLRSCTQSSLVSSSTSGGSLYTLWKRLTRCKVFWFVFPP